VLGSNGILSDDDAHIAGSFEIDVAVAEAASAALRVRETVGGVKGGGDGGG
jgi:hypothetical protein